MYFKQRVERRREEGHAHSHGYLTVLQTLSGAKEREKSQLLELETLRKPRHRGICGESGRCSNV